MPESHPHQLPQPHEPETGTFEPEAESVDDVLKLEPDYKTEESNAKGAEDYEAAHAAPAAEPVKETPVADAPVATPAESLEAKEEKA